MRPSEEKRLTEGKRVFEILKKAETRKEASEILNTVKRVNLWHVAYYADCEYKIGSRVKKDEAIKIILSEIGFKDA